MSYLEKCISFVEENFEGDAEMKNLCASAIQELHDEHKKSYKFIFVALTHKPVEDWKRFRSFGLLLNSGYIAYITKKMQLKECREHFSFEKWKDTALKEDREQIQGLSLNFSELLNHKDLEEPKPAGFVY